MAVVQQQHLLSLHRRQVSYHHDVPDRWTQKSNQFVMEGAKMVAQKPATMVKGCVFAS